MIPLFNATIALRNDTCVILLMLNAKMFDIL